MEQRDCLFQAEASGSLTPALEGAPSSTRHPRGTKEKGRVNVNETSQEKKELLLEQVQTR